MRVYKEGFCNIHGETNRNHLFDNLTEVGNNRLLKEEEER